MPKVTVEYSITPLGQTLADKIAAVTAWAEKTSKQCLRRRSATTANATADRARSVLVPESRPR